MRIKNIIAAAMSLCIFGSAISCYEPVFNDSAITASAYLYSCQGNFGDDLTWSFSGYGLSVYGTGEMYSDYSKFSEWHYYCTNYDLKENIRDISFMGTPTNIKGNIFSEMTNLESIYFYGGIERIETGAFKDCTALTSVNLAGVGRIGSSAFGGCTALNEVTISNPKCVIERNAFPETTTIKGYPYSTAQEFAQKYNYQFEELKDEQPPKFGLRSYSYNKQEINTFVHICDYQTPIERVWIEIRADDSEEWIESELRRYKDDTVDSAADAGIYISHVAYAVSGLSSASVVHYRVKAMDIAGNVSTSATSDIVLNSGENFYFGNLKDTVTEDGITYLLFDDHAEVYDCEWNVKGKVTIPDTINNLPVTKVSGFSFYYCDKITEVILPDGITEIRRNAFELCTSLQSVFLPESLENIESGIFRDCSSLKEITIPKNISKLTTFILSGCTNLTDVYIMNPDCRFNKSDIHSVKEDDYIFNGTIHGYKGSEAQKCAEQYNYNFEAIPVTEITLKVGEQYAIDEDGDNLSYQSSNGNVAIVSKSGVITALSQGQSKVFIINEDDDALVLTVNVIDETAENETVEGDINNDGAFNIADVVLFQKWLLAALDTKLDDWKAADLCKDGKLDVFDLVMMRKELLKQK